ncbi:pyridoxamine 5'-phosphate oxidase family protein [Oxalobacter vibrioformis]|uniref:Pyridoxamine 5'-phosphate oxidase family protein n=1 Tax=Oxalobacter vibrioformis TaxID=933080 RepID=A0A9E9LZG6_9BURK|nr:pyridoxamine 5'-phosphate oxidase family protein [Oxalobacter vibrioformis]NLC23903.1 NimC/NimA family protein [Oxalobacter sp.]WAW10374.1 pyridoxamine 5'-phosphate oxidase family protein [Oxalobacter vibrioformis]
MQKTIEFLKKAGTFYIATIDGDQPRVRPFGVATAYQDKLYICTANNKACFMQMKRNPKVEITAVAGEEWIRLSGEVAVDNSEAARAAVLEDAPFLKNMYSPTDGIFEVLYFTRGTAAFDSYAGVTATEEI